MLHCVICALGYYQFNVMPALDSLLFFSHVIRHSTLPSPQCTVIIVSMSTLNATYILIQQNRISNNIILRGCFSCHINVSNPGGICLTGLVTYYMYIVPWICALSRPFTFHGYALKKNCTCTGKLQMAFICLSAVFQDSCRGRSVWKS